MSFVEMRVGGLVVWGCLCAGCGATARHSPDHQVASGGARDDDGGGPYRAGSAAVQAGGDDSGGESPSGGAGAAGGGAPLEGGAAPLEGGAAPLEGGGGGSGPVAPDPSAPLVAVDCYPGFTMAEEGLSFDGRFAAVLKNAGPEPEGFALLDRVSGLPLAIETGVIADLDPPSLSGDASRLLYATDRGDQSRAYVWDRGSEQVVADYPVGGVVRGTLGFDGRFLALVTSDQTITSPPPHFQGGAVVVDTVSGDAILGSITPSAASSTNFSNSVDVSDDGERLIFASPATDLVPGKTGNSPDVYLYTHSTKTTTLVSRKPDGGFANSYSFKPRLSGDGRVAVFESAASDILGGDDLHSPDIFIIELESGDTVSPTVGSSAQSILHNLSRDGRFVAFSSTSPVAPGDGSGAQNAWVYDRLLDKTEVASVDRTGAPLASGGQAVALSGDGNVVAFLTISPELVGPAQLGVLCFSARTPASDH